MFIKYFESGIVGQLLKKENQHPLKFNFAKVSLLEKFTGNYEQSLALAPGYPAVAVTLVECFKHEA